MPQPEATMTRTEGLLALLVLRNMAEASLSDKSVALNRAGLQASEISELLGISTPSVTQNLYMARKSGKKSAKATTKKPSARVNKASKAPAKKASVRVNKARKG